MVYHRAAVACRGEFLMLIIPLRIAFSNNLNVNRLTVHQLNFYRLPLMVYGVNPMTVMMKL